MEIQASGRLWHVPDDIFKSIEEMRMVASVSDWAQSNVAISAELHTKLGIDLGIRQVAGVRTRLRRHLGLEVIPYDTHLKNSDREYSEEELQALEISKKSAEETRRRKALAGGYMPLPYKKTIFREARTRAERRYMFEYQIVRKMYRDYIEKKINFATYNKARKWFYEKYNE